MYNIPLDLKVCWYRKAGKNCSHCEKCYRTILKIVAEHGNPNDFGFSVTADTYKEIKEYLKNNYVNPAYWKPIQDAYRNERDYWTERPDMSWILDVKLNSAKALALKVVATLKKFI